jgi:hypothetical protein
MSKTKTYEVVGTQAVDGHQPGEKYEAKYDAAHEQYLITAGHVAPVKKSTPDPAPAEEE